MCGGPLLLLELYLLMPLLTLIYLAAALYRKILQLRRKDCVRISFSENKEEHPYYLLYFFTTSKDGTAIFEWLACGDLVARSQMVQVYYFVKVEQF